ncbi:YolD-like family protein [Paenibacillus sp. P26]|nr:YolD-like family protein [Paenibacillus sp. P26]UUZ95917.1 YolD-like family protein [Paenibacillus sp. P25]
MTPTRDKEALQTMIRKLGMAMFMEKEAVVTVWTDVEDQTIQGMITKLDKERKSIKIENEKEYTWVPFDHVLSIEIVQTEVQ